MTAKVLFIAAAVTLIALSAFGIEPKGVEFFELGIATALASLLVK